MHEADDWQHTHVFADPHQGRAERRTHWVIALTAVTMVVELVAGTLTGSMALLADGWHMATHVGALAITAFAYYAARRHAGDPTFTFGTGKIASLGGYTSAVALALVALLLAVESVGRLLEPETVHFREAMMVAWAGLGVNLLSAWLLGHGGADHGHHHHGHHHHDHNLRAAYLHVVADALTSVLAIIALGAGARYDWVWLDPAVGIVGSLVIARWAWGLLRDSGRVLLDAEDHGAVENEIRDLMGDHHPDARIADLHLWRVGPRSLACIVALVSPRPNTAAAYKETLAGVTTLGHVTVEVNHCTPDVCPRPPGPH